MEEKSTTCGERYKSSLILLALLVTSAIVITVVILFVNNGFHETTKNNFSMVKEDVGDTKTLFLDNIGDNSGTYKELRFRIFYSSDASPFTTFEGFFVLDRIDIGSPEFGINGPFSPDYQTFLNRKPTKIAFIAHSIILSTGEDLRNNDIYFLNSMTNEISVNSIEDVKLDENYSVFLRTKGNKSFALQLDSALLTSTVNTP